MAEKDRLDSLAGRVWFRKKLSAHTVHTLYPKQEDELYIRFMVHRMVKGYPTNHFWLTLQFRKILQETQPNGWSVFKYSAGWVVGFCQRYRISTQCAYNSKAGTDVTERQEKIREFHRIDCELAVELTITQQKVWPISTTVHAPRRPGADSLCT
jgi:hypothetical protein